jgi:hypothetical protein
MQQIRLSLVAHGDATKKIWITEYGAPTGGPGTSHEVDQLKFTYGADYMSETAQQTLITQMLGDYLRMSSWVGPVFWYSLHDNSATTNTPENFFGLLRYDWSKKPAYFTLKSFISGN